MRCDKKRTVGDRISGICLERFAGVDTGGMMDGTRCVGVWGLGVISNGIKMNKR
jgi:hypothetical protein